MARVFEFTRADLATLLRRAFRRVESDAYIPDREFLERVTDSSYPSVKVNVVRVGDVYQPNPRSFLKICVSYKHLSAFVPVVHIKTARGVEVFDVLINDRLKLGDL